MISFNFDSFENVTYTFYGEKRIPEFPVESGSLVEAAVSYSTVSGASELIKFSFSNELLNNQIWFLASNSELKSRKKLASLPLVNQFFLPLPQAL